jgi:hypothetical protein
MTEPNVDNLRKAAQAIFLACEESVAVDVSNLLRWSASEIERQEREINHLKGLVEGYRNLAR